MPSTLRILPLGDSITQGSADCPGGYRGFLERALLADGTVFEFVGGRQENSAGMTYPQHEGHPGFRIEQLRLGHTSEHSRSIPLADMLAKHRPHCVLVLAGTNNLYFDQAGDAAREFGLLIAEILLVLPGCTVLVGTLTAIRPGPKPWGDTIPKDVVTRVDTFNEHLAALVEKFRVSGARIFLADVGRSACLPADFLADGVHPNAEALRRMAHLWHQALRQSLGIAA